MKPRGFDPLRLDVAAFAATAGELAGEWPLAGFDRLASAAHDEVRPAPGDVVAWTARGERRTRAGHEPETWLHVTARTRLSLVCQRCLAPLSTELDAQRSFLFVDGEDRAAELDAELEDDVLALPRFLRLHDLVEDELLLALPLVPRHEVCPQPLPVPASDETPAERPNPFAALRGLRDGDGG